LVALLGERNKSSAGPSFSNPHILDGFKEKSGHFVQDCILISLGGHKSKKKKKKHISFFIFLPFTIKRKAK